MSPHLLVCISPHGYGHAAQVAPVLDHLLRGRPEIRLTIQTRVPEAFLRQRITHPFRHEEHATDFGLAMMSSLDVDLAASADRYRELHRDWDTRVGEEAERMGRLSPDLVLVDVPYLPLAAAGRLGIPAVALCSLNWADIYRHYFGDRAEAPAILEQMQAAYRYASPFLRPLPAMDMEWLDRLHTIGPIARRGRDIRAELRARLRVRQDERLVLLAPGGVDISFSLASWPRDTGLRWIHSTSSPGRHPDAVHLDALPYPFVDVLASVDALVGKCGYGTVAECACNGTPMLYMPRPDWPEEPFLVEWLERHGRCAPVARERVEAGDILEELEAVLALPAPDRPVPAGGVEAAEVITALL